MPKKTMHSLHVHIDNCLFLFNHVPQKKSKKIEMKRMDFQKMQFPSYLCQIQKYKRNFKMDVVLFITTSHFMHSYQYILSSVIIQQ